MAGKAQKSQKPYFHCGPIIVDLKSKNNKYIIITCLLFFLTWVLMVDLLDNLRARGR